MDKLKLAGCVILKDDKILLLHRTKRDWYELPGGKIDENESPERAAVRELREEVGCDVEIVRQIGVKDFDEDEHTMTYLWFLAKIKREQEISVREPDKFSHLKFIPIIELNNYPLSPNMKNLVVEMEKGNVSLM